MNARLLQRTTRKLSLTDVGRTYYDYCARIVGEVEDAERAVSSLQATPRGLLRVTAPVNVAFLGPIVSDYLKRYPEVRLELFCTGRRVDLVEERFDVGIRAGTLADSTLIAQEPRQRDVVPRRDAGVSQEARTPAVTRGPEEARLPAVRRRAPTARRAPRERRRVRAGRAVPAPAGQRHATSFTRRRPPAWASRCFPRSVAWRSCAPRRLERVLRDWTVPSTPVHVVYPSTRHLSPKVKSFVDYIHARMTPPPWELGPMPVRIRSLLPRRARRPVDAGCQVRGADKLLRQTAVPN